MCEFCHQHGEGKKWYLQAENYSQDMRSDLLRRIRQSGSENEILWAPPPGFAVKQYERLDQRPEWLRRLLKPYLTRYMTRRQKQFHYGQVLPIEDVASIFDMVTSIVRVACVCRQSTVGRDERYCYGVSVGPPPAYAGSIDKSYRAGPDTTGLETLSKEEALESFREHEREGCIHSVWTSPTPFIIGICNCDRSDCGALRSTFSGGLTMLFKAEYVAEINLELCNGCRQCMRVCQYGAMGCSAANKKVVIDPLRCAGCGICRSLCTKEAIQLVDRSASAVAAGVWT
jgi:Pyruvate/2-oxoacid:ferredoxin oxidoreductase delta subunit